MLNSDYEDLFREEEKPSDVGAPERPGNGDDDTPTIHEHNISRLAGQLFERVDAFNSRVNAGLGDARTYSLKVEYSGITPLEMALAILDKVGNDYEVCRIPFIECHQDGDIYDALDTANGIVALLNGLLTIIKGGDENDII